MHSRIGINQNMLGGETLRAVAGDGVAVIKVSMLCGIEFDLLAAIKSRRDLLPRIRPSWNTIWTKGRGRTMSKSRHGGADDCCAEAG